MGQGSVVFKQSFDPVATSATRARHFARSALQHLPAFSAAADTAILVVAELASNAILHARTPFQVSLFLLESGLRVEVEDHAAALPSVRAYDVDAATGRGLMLLAAMSRRWGFDAGPHGKAVWAELATDASAPATPSRPEVRISSGPPDPGADNTRLVRFLGVPVRTYIALQQHNDEIFRDLELLGPVELEAGGRREAVDAEVEAVITPLLTKFVPPRDHLREGVERADAAGLDAVDLENRFPVDAWMGSKDYVDLLETVDAFCRQERLLATPASPEVARLRRWFVLEMERQLRYGEPPSPAGTGGPDGAGGAADE
jgi:anti-sigma regulatory factor (Ser/Thr protein kinase)